MVFRYWNCEHLTNLHCNLFRVILWRSVISIQSLCKYCSGLSVISLVLCRSRSLIPTLSFKDFKVVETSEMPFFVSCSELLRLSFSLERNFCEFSISLHFSVSDVISRFIPSISAFISSLMLGRNSFSQ